MNANLRIYEEPEVKTRKDSVASAALLASIVLSVLSGTFVADPDSAARATRHTIVAEASHE